MTEKEKFMQEVVIFCDTREQKNRHIIDLLDTYKIKHEDKKLDFGDYSFKVNDRDFSLSCVLERKGSINELWTNTTTDRERFEKELATAHNIAGSVNLLIENCTDWNALKKYKVPDDEMLLRGRKVQSIGEHIHNTLMAWSSGNRYGFNVVFAPDVRMSALKILTVFYWYWHNYKSMIKPLKK